MKSKIAKAIKRLSRTRPHYYHNQVMTDELERTLLRAYMGTSWIVSPRKSSRRSQ